MKATLQALVFLIYTIGQTAVGLRVSLEWVCILKDSTLLVKRLE